MSRLQLIAGAIGLAFGLAGPVLADGNSGTINQTGAGNTATIDQTDNVIQATASIDQNGDLNTATSVQSNNINAGSPAWVSIAIQQGGNSNSAAVTQDGAFYSSADLQQSGTGNTGAIRQHDSTRDAIARMLQVGNSNTAGIDQQNISGTSGFVWQWVGAAGNTGYLYQFSESNSGAVINQRGNNTYNSSATIRQGGGIGDSMLSANIEQFDAFGASAAINQTGFNNGAVAHQNDTLGTGVVAVINQSGRFNYATTYQTSRSGASEGNYGDNAQIDQAGEFNKADIYQAYVWLSTAYIGQYWGSGNSAELAQRDMTMGNATIQQAGNDNYARIAQASSQSGGYGYAIESYINQSGDANTAEIDQTGKYQEASILQNGNGNTAKIGQDGGDPNYAVTPLNVAHISQVGNFHNAAITQTGSGNQATINQR